jgi:hypothetical protein
LPFNIQVGLNDLARDATQIEHETHTRVLSERLVKDIDTLVGSRQRSRSLTQAAEREVMRLKQLKRLMPLRAAGRTKTIPS